MQNNTLLLNVARKLRYSTLDCIIGETISITDHTQIVTTTTSFVSQFVADCTFGGPEQHFLEGQISKYGLLDLSFHAPPTILNSASVAGISLLRELGFINDDIIKLAEELDAGSTGCLEELRDDIGKNKTYLLLFLEATGSNISDLKIFERMRVFRESSKSKFPITFKVVDACVSNSSFVWINKHFYL